MTQYSFGKGMLFILIVLIGSAAVHAQPARTPLQDEFVTVLGGRIRSASEAEVATLRTQQLDPAVAAEQQTEVIWCSLAEQVVIFRDRIACSNALIANYPRIRGNMDQIAVQQVNALRREVAQNIQQLNNLNAQLTTAATAFNDARTRRLAAERMVASKQGANLQLISDFNHLYNMWQLNPPRYTWEAMSARLIEIGREKQLTGIVTVTTGNVPVTVRYQPVPGGNIQSAGSCTRCNVRLSIGYYYFWVERPGTPEPQRKGFMVFRETDSIDLSRPS